MYDLLCLGGCAVDLLVRVTRLPQSDEKMLAEYAGQLPGGLVGNTACAAARLGLKTAWSGWLGDDPYARLALDDFRAHGVDPAGARPLIGKITDSTVILLEPGGERTILVLNTLPEPPPLDEGVLAMLGQARLVYTLPRAPGWFERMAGAVHAAGGRVAVDLEASAPVRDDGLRAALAQSDLVFCARDGLALAAGTGDLEAGASELLSLGVQWVVVTLGSQGAVAFSLGERWGTPAFQVAVVDSTGAGDCFHAACLAGLAWGWAMPQALRFAAAAAALSVQQLGARGGLPDRAEVEAFLAEQTG